MIKVAGIRNITSEKTELTILKTLAYFDIFDYPLSEREIKNFLGYPVNDSAFKSTIQQLVSDKIIFKIGEFYSLQNNWQKVERRLEGNWRAHKLLPKALKIGSFLYKFPYVRGVAISGSLSKNYADERADIDFFIITKKDRLWIARTILHLFKKFTFLIGRQNWYCMNYFIDEDALSIKERNIYTAIEVVTVIPVAGSYMMNKFFEINNWAKKWFHRHMPETAFKISEKNSIVKKFIEWIFNRKTGEKLDNFLYAWTQQRWRKKEKLGRKNSKGKLMNLVTDKHFSKSNPGAFQEKIVTAYKNKIDQFVTQWPQYFN